MIQFIIDCIELHSGILTALFIVGCFSVIGWASDEWENRKNKEP